MSQGEMEENQQSLKDLISLRSKLIDQISQSAKLLEEVERSISAIKPTEIMVTPSVVKSDVNHAKIKTGVEKLDQLLIGGYPPGSNITLNGPPFSSKERFVADFIRESLSEHFPTIIVAVDREPAAIKNLVQSPDLVRESQEKGILKVVDAYSRFVQSDPSDPLAVVIDGTSNLSNFLKSIDTICASTIREMGTYRMVVFSLTGLLTQTDEKSFIKAIQHFSQRRKAEGATTIYMLESGLFERRIYENINYFMDISLDFRLDDLNEYLRIRGLNEVRTKEWVEVITTGGKLDLGSFDLRRIR